MLPGIMGRSRKCQVARRGGAEAWKQELLPQLHGASLWACAHQLDPHFPCSVPWSMAITMAVLIGLKTGLGPFCHWEQFLFPVTLLGPWQGEE